MTKQFDDRREGGRALIFVAIGAKKRWNPPIADAVTSSAVPKRKYKLFKNLIRRNKRCKD